MPDSPGESIPSSDLLEAIRSGETATVPYAEPQNDTECLRLFVLLHLTRGRLERQLETIAAVAGPLGERLLQYFIENNVQNTTIDGCTVYLRSQLWASLAGATPEQRALSVEALRASEAGVLIKETVNTSSLSAWVREGVAEGRFPEDPETLLPLLPEGLREHVTLRDEMKVQVRKGR